MTAVSNNLNDFTKHLLVHTMSFFPELAILKYLQSRNAVQKEWGDNFDTNTKKILKDLWELVNNKNGEYYDLFSKKLVENKSKERKFSLKELYLSIIPLSEGIIENKNYSHGKYYMGHTNKENYLSSGNTEISFNIKKVSEGKFNFELKYKIILPEVDGVTTYPTADQVEYSDFVYENLLTLLNTINCLSSLTDKINQSASDTDWVNLIVTRYVEEVYHPYLSFFIDFDINIDKMREDNDDEFVDCKKFGALRKYEKKVYDEIISILSSHGLPSAFTITEG